LSVRHVVCTTGIEICRCRANPEYSTTIKVYFALRLFTYNCELSAARDQTKILYSLFIKLAYRLYIKNVLRTIEAWASAAEGREGPWPSWIFVHGTDIVDRGLIVLFFGIFPLLSSPPEKILPTPLN